MSNLIAALAVLILLFASASAVISLMRHFFPSTSDLLPTGWGKWLSFRFTAYYLIAGFGLLWLSQ